MIDYYTKFIGKAKTISQGLINIANDAGKLIPRLQKRLAEEKNKLDRQQRQADELDRLSSESLSGDGTSFEKYKTTMRRYAGEIEIMKDVIDKLENKLIPEKRATLKSAQANLKRLLDAYVIESHTPCNQVIDDLLRDILAERQAFLDGFAKIYQDLGLTFNPKEEQCPGRWRSDEICDMTRQLNLGPEERIVKAAPMPASDGKPAVVEPEIENPAGDPESEILGPEIDGPEKTVDVEPGYDDRGPAAAPGRILPGA